MYEKKYSMNNVISRKLDRILRGKQPNVLDLFSGCGGISLGFDLAGCSIIGGIEQDAHAVKSHALNFHSGDCNKTAVHSIPRDITTLSPSSYLRELGYNKPQDVVDILVGGPPCPAFARVGRAKLREVQEHPDAFRHDPRAKLYLPYLDFVRELQPVALLMENVPDILNYGGHNLAEEICDILEEWSYECKYTLLNAANYGVPQMRERFFLIGIHRDAECDYKFPVPTRLVDFPQGYKSSRQVALKHIKQDDLFEKYRYVQTPASPAEAGPPVTVREAIEDLPTITGHLNGTIKRGARKFDTSVEYRQNIEVSEYALKMRSWPGFEGDGQIWDHVTRSLSKRDYRLFSNMNEGDDYPKAFRLAEKLFNDFLLRNDNLETDNNEYSELRASYVPPYDPGKFPNKWRKMESDQPARTLMAHLGKDSYSHIHYDSVQARVLSVREAARLQSFPDGFRFSGTMNPAFRQIGNAVPPLMVFALASSLLQAIYSSAHTSAFVRLLQERQIEYLSGIRTS